MNPNEMANHIAEAIARMREILAPVDEATLGYRRQLEDHGWSSAAAEKMAVSFHAMLISQFGGAKR